MFIELCHENICDKITVKHGYSEHRRIRHSEVLIFLKRALLYFSICNTYSGPQELTMTELFRNYHFECLSYFQICSVLQCWYVSWCIYYSYYDSW